MSLSSVRLSEGIITQNVGHEHCISGPSVFTAIRSNMEGQFEDMRQVFAITMVKIPIWGTQQLKEMDTGYKMASWKEPAWTVDPANPVARWQQFSKF